MSEEPTRREADQTAMAKAASAARATSRTFWQWFDQHHLDALTVLTVTLFLSIKVIDWALEYAYANVPGTSGAERAGIIAAVLGPWGLAQSAMFKFYVELKAKKNGAT